MPHHPDPEMKALHLAAFNGQLKILCWIDLIHGGQYGNAFKAAAVGGHAKIIQLLLAFTIAASVSLWPLASAAMNR